MSIKKTTLTGIILTSFLTSNISNAQKIDEWFEPNSNIIVNPESIRVATKNNSNYIWNCKGRVYGVTGYGDIVKNEVNFEIFPGSYKFNYVTTSRRNPFIDGGDKIRCRFYLN